MKKADCEKFDKFLGRVGIIQRVLPAYRAKFFNALAQVCSGGVSIFAGESRLDESLGTIDRLVGAEFVPAKNWELFHPHRSPYFLWQGGLIKWLKAWDPDVLVVEANVRYLRTRAAIRWMHKNGRPVVGWGLGVPGIEMQVLRRGFLSGFQYRLWRSFLLSLDSVIAYSKQGAQQYQQIGFRDEQVFVAPNAVASRPKEPLIERLPRFEGAPKVLFVGRLLARKRIDNLLKACAALPADIQPQVWIIGDGPYSRELQSLSAEIYPEATFFGAVRGEALKPYFAQADLFVLPGTGGLAVQEAMAAGLPVIVAEGDGTQGDWVRMKGDKYPGNGWLIPSNDVQVLEQTLRLALSDAKLLRQMGAESFRIVIEDYNLENMVKVFVTALSTAKFLSV